MRISVLVVALGCASSSTAPAPPSNTPPAAPAPSATDLRVDVRATPLPDEAVRLDYTITNVSSHAAQVLGQLAGSYSYRERRAAIRRDGEGPIELHLGATEGCDGCVTDTHGIAGDRAPAGPAFETLAPGASVRGAVDVGLPNHVELARDVGIVLVVRVATVNGQKVANAVDVRSAPARPPR